MSHDQHAHFMREAIRLAQRNMDSLQGGPFGAVIVRDGKIISTGVNQVTSHNDPTAHAEVVAIRNACAQIGHWDLHACEIYTSCEPCPMCLGAIWWARLHRIWYAANQEQAAQAGFDDARFYDELALPAHARTISMHNILPEEGKLVLHAWQDKQDKIPY
ncbi:MAG: nucleoside deaminase [Hahellaceae bacterium]|nr:nucleoside deaminase [Hahellaceae bacterium]MCP5168412.1 nucleoside deaminase [Hahellaceae bacterium]